MLKRTPLYEVHRRLGAKMVPFAGFEMPVQYGTGVIEEHLAVRSSAGLFDVCHMGQILIEGNGALDFVQHVTTNDAAAMAVKQVQYTLFCYPDGGAVDDLTLYRLDAERFLLCVNASRCDDDFAWLQKAAAEQGFSGRLENLSADYGLLALQGPAAAAILGGLTPADLNKLAYYHFVEAETAGVPGIISHTGYTGEDGFELYLPTAKTVAVWDALLEAGKNRRLAPVGLGARDTLRLEKKYPLYGHELGPDITPLEAGLGWVVKLAKADFIGKAALEKMKRDGIPRQSLCLKMEEPGIPREGYVVFDAERPVGKVTSGTLSPSLRQGIAIALVTSGAWKTGQILRIEIHGKKRAARIVKPPFYPVRETE